MAAVPVAIAVAAAMTTITVMPARLVRFICPSWLGPLFRWGW